MVIWLNGPFGVGKTTVAWELTRQLPEARLVDPERIGYVMRRTLWRGIDYQEVPLWRALTVRWIDRAARSGRVIVPMTVVDPPVFAQLTRGAFVVALTASRSTMEARIAGSEVARAWRLQNLDRCLAAFETGRFGTPIATDGCTPGEVAGVILSRL